MVLKAPDEVIIVEWHRDAAVPAGCTDPRPIFNVDFYLDEADLPTCLWVIPQSQNWTKEQANERCARPGFDTSDAISVPIQPGDVIFHGYPSSARIACRQRLLAPSVLPMGGITHLAYVRLLRS